jgi:hypothetical protein
MLEQDSTGGTAWEGMQPQDAARLLAAVNMPWWIANASAQAAPLIVTFIPSGVGRPEQLVARSN